ncbi:hypothetical protein KR018_008540 [Drosophila ironensis]|nr:hypothetical protein KR018_008540 [Drosophila ironensis]
MSQKDDDIINITKSVETDDKKIAMCASLELANCRMENWRLKKKLLEYESTISSLEKLVTTIAAQQNHILREVKMLQRKTRQIGYPNASDSEESQCSSLDSRALVSSASMSTLSIASVELDIPNFDSNPTGDASVSNDWGDRETDLTQDTEADTEENTGATHDGYADEDTDENPEEFLVPSIEGNLEEDSQDYNGEYLEQDAEQYSNEYLEEYPEGYVEGDRDEYTEPEEDDSEMYAEVPEQDSENEMSEDDPQLAMLPESSDDCDDN